MGSVHDLLAMPESSDIEVLAGSQKLNREVTSIISYQEMHPPLVKGGEMLVLQHTNHEHFSLGWLQHLAEHGAAALLISRDLQDKIPVELVDWAEEQGFPLLLYDSIILKDDFLKKVEESLCRKKSSDDLLTGLLFCADWQSFANKLNEITHGYLAILSADFQVLGQAGGNLPVHELRRLVMDAVHSLEESEHQYIHPILYAGKIQGYLYLKDTKKQLPVELSMIRDYMQLFFRIHKEHKMEWDINKLSLTHSWLQHLLVGRYPLVKTREKSSSFGLRLPCVIFVCQFPLLNHAGLPSSSWQARDFLIECIQKTADYFNFEYTVVPFPSYVALVVHYEGTGHPDEIAWEARKIEESLNKTLFPGQVFVAAGRSAGALEAVPLSFQQALDVLEIRIGLKKDIHVYDHIGFLRLIQKVGDDPEIDQYCHEVLGDLLSDDEKMSQLLETLDVYLQTGGNMKQCADRLYLHSNSIRYRLNKIEQITGRRLDHPAELLEYQVALAISRWRYRRP